MTNDQMMKKLGAREDKAGDGKDNEKVKNQIFKYLKEGKSKLLLLEQQITGGKDFKRIQEKVIRSKKNLEKAKQNYDKYEKKAENYIEKNPKKAIAMAIAAGLLVGTIWSSFKKKKAVLKKKNKFSQTTHQKPSSPRSAGKRPVNIH